MTALRPERKSDTSYGQQSYGAPGAFEDWSGSGAYGASPQPEPQPNPQSQPYMSEPEPDPYSASYEPLPEEPYLPPVDEETVALRIPDPPPAAGDSTAGSPGHSAPRQAGPAHGGRAARRKAAKGRHGRHGGAPDARPAQEESAQQGRRAPLSRVEARRQARARKPGAAVVASRAIGEVFITTGVLMLLFVTYQLWWTNVRAHAQAGSEASSLQDDWASGKRNPGAFEPGQGFAILHIPKLDVVVPIAEGTSNKGVLDRGMVGHYADGALKTAMPGDKSGNFGLAGHRNTHGEPFRYINRLTPGDPIVVETQDDYFVYKMASILPVTPPSNTSVLKPVPPGSGFTEPGRYITLTTCTPEFTSKYRMIVWGKMVEERPRSKGKPDALVS
ncbi:class E sortase [Streptomyces violarus]|uniref:Sortase A n=1 Tax=Streptomyces violarus TaxID=67380 RepID=A0A7W4ZSH7_9ACTN|nr:MULTISPECIES: class E sortase [Streptomyces]MBB3077845.1 sortase A [Streptomyces violarus]WRT99975.1 class E sortase [Streptomyces sp. CGMCC 4.1772]GHD18491.1 class E sortase [Streptomyces violarus]